MTAPKPDLRPPANAPATLDRVPNQPRTPNTTFRIPVDLKAEAQRIAAERGETVTDVLVAALRRYVKRHGGKA